MGQVIKSLPSATSVCLSVCLSVCVSPLLYGRNYHSILTKLSTRVWNPNSSLQYGHQPPPQSTHFHAPPFSHHIPPHTPFTRLGAYSASSSIC